MKFANQDYTKKITSFNIVPFSVVRHNAGKFICVLFCAGHNCIQLETEFAMEGSKNKVFRDVKRRK